MTEVGDGRLAHKTRGRGEIETSATHTLQLGLVALYARVMSAYLFIHT